MRGAQLARPGRRPAGRNFAEPCCEQGVLITSNRYFLSVRRVAFATWKLFSKQEPYDVQTP